LSWPSNLSQIEYVTCSTEEESHDCKKNLDLIFGLFNKKSLKDGDVFPPTILTDSTSWQWNHSSYNDLLGEMLSINAENHDALESSSNIGFDQNTLMINGVIRYENSKVPWNKATAFNITPSIYVVPNPNGHSDMAELLSHATVTWMDKSGDDNQLDHSCSHFVQDEKYPFLIRRLITTNPVLPGSVITLSRRRRSERKFTTTNSSNNDDDQQYSDLGDNDDTSSIATPKGNKNVKASGDDKLNLKRCFEDIYKATRSYVIGLEPEQVSQELVVPSKVRKVKAKNPLQEKYLSERFLEIGMPKQCDFTFSKKEVKKLQLIDRLVTVNKESQKVNGSLIPLLQFCLFQAKNDSLEEHLSLARTASEIFGVRENILASQTEVLQKVFEYRSGLKEMFKITFTQEQQLQYTATDPMFKEFTVFTAASPPQVHIIPPSVVCEKENAGVLMAFMEVS